MTGRRGVGCGGPDGMRRISLFLWVALAGAVLQLTALGSDFYIVGGKRRDAWLGIPHASDLILASAVVTVVFLLLIALDRSPVRGRSAGLAVGVVGLLATLQLGYRMIVPPFGCMTYGCGLDAAREVTLLPGIWFGLVGCVLATVGGFGHAFSRPARETEARPWRAPAQGGMTPWLGLAALGAVGQFVFGFTAFAFYTVSGFAGMRGTSAWGGWLSIPHTGSLVLLMSAATLFVVATAARERSPLSPPAIGAAIAIFGFIAASRLAFRILEPPFSAAGGEATHVGSVKIELGGWLSLASAVLVFVAGLVHAALHRKAERVDHSLEERPQAAVPGST